MYYYCTAVLYTAVVYMIMCNVCTAAVLIGKDLWYAAKKARIYLAVGRWDSSLLAAGKYLLCRAAASSSPQCPSMHQNVPQNVRAHPATCCFHIELTHRNCRINQELVVEDGRGGGLPQLQ